MKDRKKHFLKDAVVVLIAVFMVTSILPSAIANTEDNNVKLNSDLGPIENSGNPSLIRPGSYLGEASLDDAYGPFADQWYYKHIGNSHDNSLANDCISLTSSGTMYCGFTIDLSGELGNTITQVSYLDYGDGTGAGLSGLVTIHEGDLGGTHNPVGTPEAFTTTDSGVFEDIILSDPVTITASTYSIVWQVTQTGASQFVYAVDSGPVNPGGDWISLDGVSWVPMGSTYGFPYNWLQEVYVEGGGGPEPSEDCIPDACDFAIKGFSDEFNAQSKGVDVNGDGKIDYYVWNSLPKEICIKIANKGEIGIGELKLLLDLYKKVCGPTITIYDDPKYDLTQFPCCGVDYPIDFEGWHIMDDCDGDSWVLQGGAENRWLCNDQAWRNTKGEDRTYGADEDVYLGLADCVQPGAYDELWTPCFDVVGAACADISFSQWVEGEYTIDEDGIVTPVDYGTLSYSLDCGQTWIEIPITQFLAYDSGGAWVDVNLHFMNTAIDADDLDYMHPYNMICDDCEPEEDDIVINANLSDAQGLMLAFIWHKDPCLQFEGWYIDCLKVTMTLDYELELVCQTHEILELPPCDPEVGVQWMEYCFPLPCDVEDDTWYEVHIYGQVFDPMGCEADIENNEFKYQFKIKDIRDVACIEILPDDHQYVDVGETIPINVTVKNLGTFGESNVPVDIEVGSLVNYQLLEDHYETNTLGDYSIYYFNFPGCPTLMPYTWSKGWSQISQIYDNAPAEARSMLPGSECVVFGENVGGLPTLPEDTGMLFVAPDTLDIDPNKNGKDCADPISGEMTFAAKWSMEPGSSNVYLAILPSEGPGEGWVSFYSLGIESDPDGYENDWQAFEFDLYDLLSDLIGEDYGTGTPYTYIPPVTIGFFVYNEGPCTEANMNYMSGSPNGGSINPNNPVPWTGFMLDNWKISLQDYDAASMTTYTTLYTGELQPGEEETLYTSWPAELCSHVITADVNLAGDVDTYNDGCCAVVVTATQKECLGEYKVDDMTPVGGDCLWHVCCNREIPDDCFAWAGEETEHSAQYVNNMNDYMVSPMIDVTGFESYGVAVNFSTWFEFYNKADFGDIQIKKGNNWETIWKTKDLSSGGVFIPATAYIDEETCTNYSTFQLRFGMHSDASGVDEGWYVDDIQIVDVTGFAASFADEWISYNDGYTENAYAWNGALSWTIAIELSSPEIDPYIGYDITDGLVSGGSDDYGFYANAYEVYASTGALPDMTTIGDDETLLGSGVSSGAGWTSFACDPYQVTGTTYFILKWLDGYTGYPCGFDYSNSNPKGGYMLYYQTTNDWSTTLVDLWGSGVWGFDAGLTSGTPTNLIYGDPIPGIFQGPDTATEDFEDQDIAPWTCDTSTGGGQFWRKTDDPALVPNGVLPLDEDPCEDCTSGFYVIPSTNLAVDGYGSGIVVDNAIAFKVDLTNPLLNPNLILFTCMMNYNLDEEKAYIEFSPDWDGLAPMEEATWVPYWAHTSGDLYGDSTGGWVSLGDLTAMVDPVPMERWNIDEFYGEVVWVRFRLETDGGGAGIEEGWAIDDLYIEFKETGTAFVDEEAPITSFCYDAATQTVTLLAVDLPLNKGVGVDDTFYKVDGGATQTYGGPFKITGEGPHTVEYWSVDNNGNEETHHTTSITIDTLPPVVEITSPEAGKLYLFGSPLFNRILSDSTLCIGKVPVSATATDASGVLQVLFKYDGETHWDNAAPYEDTYNEMHFGPLTISVSAIDTHGLTSTPVTMDIVVYSLGLF